MMPMCGRYRFSRRKQILAEHFDAVPFDDDWFPRYNIAPTQPVPVIRQHPKESQRVDVTDAVGINSFRGQRR
jgi:putative SOS response-associated peptidase YedK